MQVIICDNMKLLYTLPPPSYTWLCYKENIVLPKQLFGSHFLHFSNDFWEPKATFFNEKCQGYTFTLIAMILPAWCHPSMSGRMIIKQYFIFKNSVGNYSVLYIYNKVSCFDVQNSTIIVILQSNVHFNCKMSLRIVFKR